MFRIQTVCTGNICRSPMAQFALARAFRENRAARGGAAAGATAPEAAAVEVDPALQTSGGRPEPSAVLGIEDPWYGNSKDFESAYGLISAAVPGVTEYVDRLLADRSGSRNER